MHTNRFAQNIATIWGKKKTEQNLQIRRRIHEKFDCKAISNLFLIQEYKNQLQRMEKIHGYSQKKRKEQLSIENIVKI